MSNAVPCQKYPEILLNNHNTLYYSFIYSKHSFSFAQSVNATFKVLWEVNVSTINQKAVDAKRVTVGNFVAPVILVIMDFQIVNVSLFC